VRIDPNIRAAIAAIPEDAWIPIPTRAIWDDQLGRWVSDAQIAEVKYTAFVSRKRQAITARLIVRQVKDLNRNAAPGQGELFTAWRHHAVFTDSPFTLVQAEEQDRGYAQAEQVFADWTAVPLAHLRLRLVPRQRRLARPRRDQLQPATRRRGPGQPHLRQSQRRHDPPRLHQRRRAHRPARPDPLTVHLPEGWHREYQWMNLFEAACGAPAAAS